MKIVKFCSNELWQKQWKEDQTYWSIFIWQMYEINVKPYIESLQKCLFIFTIDKDENRLI